MAAGRIKIGPWTTPWVANGMLRDRRRRAPARAASTAILSTKLDDAPTSLRVPDLGQGREASAAASARSPRNFVAWVYADPKGPEHNTLNCSISDLELEVERAGAAARAPRASSGGAAYEIGMRQTDHGIPLQPYPDG